MASCNGVEPISGILRIAVIERRSVQYLAPPIYMVPVTPPLTEIHCAVSQRLFSETRSNAASAISSTVPIRASARVCASTAFNNSADEVPSAASKNGLAMSVMIGPGARVFTVIPWLRPSYYLALETAYLGDKGGS